MEQMIKLHDKMKEEKVAEEKRKKVMEERWSITRENNTIGNWDITKRGETSWGWAGPSSAASWYFVVL